MSKYYHVVVEKINGTKDVLYRDLSKKDLKKHFVKTYKKGDDVFIEDTIHKIQTIKKVQIIKTEYNFEDELEAFENEENESREKANRTPGPILLPIALGESDIVFRGKDVTSHYINKAPSKSPNLFSRIINSPWTVRIIGGVILIVIAWYLSKHFGVAP